MATGEDDLICDFAEFYHVFDIGALPPTTAAALSVGLPMGSRTKKRLAGMRFDFTDMLLALIVDGINILIWQNTKDGHKNRRKPKSLYKKLTEEPEKKEEYKIFRSPDAFEAWYQKRMNHG